MQPPITGNNNNSVEEKFFNNHASTEPLVKALNGFLQRTNDTLHFVEKTVSRIGYPRWDKALSFAKLATAGKGNSADSTTITYIPFVRDSQNYVNATMIIQSSFSDTIFNYLCDWQYSRFGYDTTSNTWNAKDVFHLFSKFDYAVFDRIMFKITDPQLFGNPGNGRFPVVKIKQPEIDEKKANKVSNYVTVETCTIYDVCYGTPEEYQNHCGGYCTEDCDLYDHSEEICTILYEGTGGIGGDPGGGGGGGTGDGSGGDGGATGGGENGDGTPGDCNGNPTEGNRTAINNTCGPGWEPIPIEDEPPPASTDPCAKIDSIKERASFRNAFTDLKNRTSEHKEYGYRVDDNNNDTTYYFIPGMPDEEDGVQWYFYDTVFFLLHSHFSGGLPIFSGGDFETIAALYDADFLNTEKFFFGVATETGSYILTIENPDKFELFREKYIDIGRKSKRLEAKYRDYKIGNFSDNNINIIEFLNLMNDLDMGMSLLKANDDFSNFYKVSLVNDTLNFQACN